MTFDDYAWWVQVGLSLLFARHLARVAARKGRHPAGAALLMLAFANGWPLMFGAAGRGIATEFHVNPLAQATMARIFGYGGLLFGVAVSYAVVGCLRPARGRGKP